MTADGAPMTAQDVLAALTRDEKIAFLHQHAPAVERLGLAAFTTGTEALHGLAWLGTATVFPQPPGLAASWDPALLRAVGEVASTEVRAKHAQDPRVSLNVWAPVVNTLRHPLWGRGEEGYSEDPDVTAELATAYCRGLRGDHPTVWRTVPTLKHFLAYGNEVDRAVTSSHLPPQALRETELPAFEGPLRAGVVGAVMPSYNLVNGRPNHVAADLLDELRSWAPHSIAVVSDAQAPSNLVDGERYFPDHTQATAAALRAGVDSFTDNDRRSDITVERVTAALDAGLITEADVDRAVLRLLELRERTGELAGGGPESSPFGIGPDAIDLPAHRTLAREAAARGVVVLRNDSVRLQTPTTAVPADRALPLTDPRVIAVVGPFADHVVTDWYSGTPPYAVTLAAALRERYPDADVRVADGGDVVALRTGGHLLTVSPDGDAVTATEVDPARESTRFTVTDWGHDIVTLRSHATGRLLTGASWIVAATAERVGGWVAQETFRRVAREGGIALQHAGSGRWLRVQHGSRLLVTETDPDLATVFEVEVLRSGADAVREACAGADVALVALGNDPHVHGRETADRPDLDLPAPQRAVWEVARRACPHAVLTLVSSYPYAVAQEAAQAAAVVWSSHAGQELGHGLVDVLSGDREPTGRLPQTWWARGGDAGDLLDYDVVTAGQTYRYNPAAPLFGLGHGLGYSTVEHESATLSTSRVEAPPVTLEHAPARWVEPGADGGSLAGLSAPTASAFGADGESPAGR
ncbi:MAG: glycoside hydrolase family 3 protein, partial [Actinomycetales bacterium]|nr:glycoside hydrolase family 3 protein [Actinomycetales bacterium]